MDYEILIEEYYSQKQIHCIASGTMTENERDAAIKETVRVARKEYISNIIWNVSETEVKYSLIGSHLVIEKLKDFGLAFTDHIAVVYKNNKAQHEHSANAAFNRYNNVVFFYNDIEAARKWLLQFK